MNEQEIKRILEDHEERIKKLERIKLPNKDEIIQDKKKNFKGLAGGVRLLIKNNFFKEPKNLNETIAELKREGHHYTKAGISSTLSETFMKNEKILNRIREDKSWKYVIRK